MTSSQELPATLVRVAPRLARGAGLLERAPHATIALTIGTGVATFAVILLTGGTPSPLAHLAYIPISIAAYRGGFLAAVLASLAGAVMLGPVMYLADLEGDGEFGLPWLTRGAMFVAVGCLLGWLSGEARSRTSAWREAAVEVTSSQQAGMLALARAAEAKDPTTGDHLFRCRDLAGVLAREAGLEPLAVADIAWSAMLHDIGKLYLPDHVLSKPGPLDPEEWELIREHPIRGAEILGHGRMFETARRIARWHHENLDGTGYPDRLRGGAIPIEARIVRIVDAWDAITNDRPYRAALSQDRAVQELRDHAGRWFDPDLVELLIRYFEAGAPYLRR